MLPTVINKRQVYLDYAATTHLAKEVKTAMDPYLNEKFGNPSSLYDLGREAKEAINASRESMTKQLNCRPEEIIFTGSGTMSNNLAILGVARARQKLGKHLITTAIEHVAVLKPFEYLVKKEGFKTTILPVDGDGLIKIESIERAINDATILISVMYANNEIGTIQPIIEIGRLLKRVNKKRAEKNLPYIYFHTDACQAAGFLSLDVQKLGVDLLTLNGGKIYGPKGTGALFIRREIELEPLIIGGGQEKGLIAGTENVANIVGLSVALKLVQKNREEENVRLVKLRDYFISELINKIPKCRLNGHPTKRLANNVNVSILDVEGEAMLLYLNEYGISSATGSACDSATLNPSHVILALGLPYEFAHGSLRFTLGKTTTKKDVDYVLKILKPVVEALREISPVKLEESPKKNKHPKFIQH